MHIINCNGFDIYNAAVAGAKCGYNRSTDNSSRYAELIGECYNELLADVGDEDLQQQIIKNTNGKWQEATLPLCLALLHHHKAGKKCETHARVFLATNPVSVFDIPLLHWQRLCKQSEQFNKQLAA